MAFPDQWFQYWPQYVDMVSPWSSSVFWLLPESHFDPTPLHLAEFNHGIRDWTSLCFTGLICGNTPGANNPSSYLKVFPSFMLSGVVGGVFVDVAPTLPGSQCVVVRRLTGDYSPSGRGRVFLSNVRQEHVDGDTLNNLGYNFYKDICNNWTSNFSAGGVTWRHCLVSYKHGTAVPVRRVQVMRRLGVIHRRCHHGHTFHPIGPKDPPL